MGITIRATQGGSNSQNNITDIKNTKEGYFSHFSIIGINSFEKFGAFGGGNNNNNPPSENNNNNSLSLLLPLGFGKKLRGGFNSLLKENVKGLDLNIAALVNALTEVNLKINHIKRKSNHVKLTEFERMEVKDPNEQLK